MVDKETQRRTGGRSARVRAAVLAATLDAVARDGAASVNIGEVARAAGVHETSIYRRWATRENLVLDALLTSSQEQLPIPDTGSLHTDLLVFVRAVAAYLTSPLGDALARSMTVADDAPDIAEGRADFWRSRGALAATMLHRAAQRGEVANDLNALVVLEMLVAPLHFRALITRQPLDDAFLELLVDHVLGGIGFPTNTM